MIAFRLLKKKFSHHLSGKGASICGGRWNSIGTEIIYCSSSRALSLLETYVHIPSGLIPRDMTMMSIDIPDSISKTKIDTYALVDNWSTVPFTPSTQKLGDDFVRAREYCVLIVPSAIIPGDYNLLINPLHPDFKKNIILEVHDFPFDDRLFKK